MELLASVLEAVPGLPFVFAIAALLLLENDSEIAEAIRVFVVAWCLYRISKRLDGLFGLFYGPKPEVDKSKPEVGQFWHKLRTNWYNLRMKRLLGYESLEASRKDAMDGLHLEEVEGLYEKAKQKVETSKEWKKQIDPLIGVSKAARAFIFPFFLIGIGLNTRMDGQWLARVGKWSLLAGFREDFARAQERLEFLKDPVIPWGVCLFSVFWFVYLRWRHMKSLYDLAGALGKRETDHDLHLITGTAADAPTP
jgi:hypothetical protein